MWVFHTDFSRMGWTWKRLFCLIHLPLLINPLLLPATQIRCSSFTTDRGSARSIIYVTTELRRIGLMYHRISRLARHALAPAACRLFLTLVRMRHPATLMATHSVISCMLTQTTAMLLFCSGVGRRMQRTASCSLTTHPAITFDWAMRHMPVLHLIESCARISISTVLTRC